MTDNLYKAIEIADRGNGGEILYDENLIVDWLDDKVDVINKVLEIYKASPQSLCMGDFDEKDGKYATEIETCAWLWDISKKEVFIFKGIKILADVVGAELFNEPHCQDKNLCFYFNYKGVKFYELCDIGEKLR